MAERVAGADIERLIQLLARLPGLGPRSARRAALHLLRKREALMLPLADAIAEAAAKVRPCTICADPRRDAGLICVVEQVGDLWALERTGSYRGRYHVLGGTLSALDGVGPDELNIARLITRLGPGTEMILALNATVEGQTTAHYIADRAEATGAR